MHEIDGVGCVLDSDGTLQVERSGSPVVTFAPGEAYSLLTFLRLPGVAETIERSDADQQAEDFAQIEEEEREEVTREQAYAYLHNDQDLQQRIVTEAIRAFRERLAQRKTA
jgi:hypothetical protein